MDGATPLVCILRNNQKQTFGLPLRTMEVNGIGSIEYVDAKTIKQVILTRAGSRRI